MAGGGSGRPAGECPSLRRVTWRINAVSALHQQSARDRAHFHRIVRPRRADEHPQILLLGPDLEHPVVVGRGDDDLGQDLDDLTRRRGEYRRRQAVERTAAALQRRRGCARLNGGCGFGIGSGRRRAAQAFRNGFAQGMALGACAVMLVGGMCGAMAGVS